MQTQPPDHLGTGELAQTRTHGQAKQPVWEDFFRLWQPGSDRVRPEGTWATRNDVAGL